MPRTIGKLMLTYGLLLAGLANAAESSLIAFSIEDRKGKTRTEKEFIGESFILIASDKGGSEYNDAWMTKIQTDLKEGENTAPAKILAVADLSAVPSLMRTAVKVMLPKPETINLLLDWEGVFLKAYEFKAGKANILVFSHTGDLIFQDAVTKLDETKAESIVVLIAEEQKVEKEAKELLAKP